MDPPAHTPLSTTDLYNQWASTYDTDSNVLQAVDDLALDDLLPDFIYDLRSPVEDTAPDVLDLGCGTGRNTRTLTSLLPRAPIRGYDASEAMLAIARQKCPSATFKQVDIAEPEFRATEQFDAVISTLVLEHLPLETFFPVLASLLHSGGRALVTNMHPDMGNKSFGAGFKATNGERRRAVSFVHEIGAVVVAASQFGLQMLGDVQERAVDEAMIEAWKEKGLEGVVGRAEKWRGVKVWFGVIFEKK